MLVSRGERMSAAFWRGAGAVGPLACSSIRISSPPTGSTVSSAPPRGDGPPGAARDPARADAGAVAVVPGYGKAPDASTPAAAARLTATLSPARSGARRVVLGGRARHPHRDPRMVPDAAHPHRTPRRRCTAACALIPLDDTRSCAAVRSFVDPKRAGTGFPSPRDSGLHPVKALATVATRPS
jgi:hypothetical protein